MNNPVELIVDIYNYCDIWCERCLFTNRCRSFQIQTETGLAKPIEAGSGAVQQLTEALALTKQYIDTMTRSEASVPAGESVQGLEMKAARHRQTQNHPLSILATEYLKKTGMWLSNEKHLLEKAGQQQIQAVKLGLRTQEEAMPMLHALYDAWEMIRWYRTLIPVKTQSALRILTETTSDAQLLAYHLGKVKLVLVSIDRSLLAWQTLLVHHPEKTDALLDLLSVLSRLRRELEAQFPEARAFLRPGFD